MPETRDLIWIEDAAHDYRRTRKWLQKQIDEGRLSEVIVPGDRRKYLLRSQLDQLMRPRVQDNGEK